MNRTGNRQSGIAIGPILFVVAILAVLASAIAAGSGAFNSDTSAVSAKAQATAILEYAEQVKMSVDRVLGHGCTDTQISFENPIVSGYTNPNAPSDKSCHVFDVNGGGISWLTLPANALDQAQHDSQNPTSSFGSYSIATSCGIGLGTGTGSVFSYNATGFPCYYAGAGAYESSSDLFVFAFWLRKDVCEEINKLAGISVMPGQDNALSAIGGITGFEEKFKGDYGGGGAGMVRVENPRGAIQGCVNDTIMNYGGGYYYFRALVIR